MRECPHCHEDAFGIRDLLVLDYFSHDECKACGKLVRNDGFRQFLTLPAILVALFFAVVVFSSVPNSLQPFGLLLLVVLIALPVVLLAKPVKVEYPQGEVVLFTPDLENDKMIVVKGWSEDELGKILDDFTARHSTQSASFRVQISKRYEDCYWLTFPQDISPSEFSCLINYLTYPMNFGLAGRSIIVAGKTTLNSDSEGIPQTLMGKKAVIYVPENDKDYDVVYLQIETGAAFANTISNHDGWRPVDDSRVSEEVKMLTW